MINSETISSAFSYEKYLNEIKLLTENNRTSGEDQSQELVEYTKLNYSRMKRLNKTITINDELQSALNDCKEPMIWLVLTEAWCGDAAQNIPLFNKLSEQKKCIDLKLIFRDQNLDIMDQYLTNGGRSIPKLVALRKSDLKVLGTWGPRPAAAQRLVERLKNEEGLSHDEWVKEIQLWYSKDKTISQQKEMAEAIKNWQEESNK